MTLLRRWEAQSRTLESFAASSRRKVALGDDAAHDTVAGATITPSFTEMLRVAPVGTVPGVRQVTLGGFPGALLGTTVGGGPFAIEEPDVPQTIDLPFCEMPFVGPRYFRIVGVPLLHGRGFDSVNQADASNEVVVNQAVARRLWPNGNALGAKLRVDRGARTTWLTVVGVAGDLHLPGVNGDLFNLRMYRPASAASELAGNVVLRLATGASAAAVEPMLRRAVEGVGFSATLQSVDPAESTFDRRVLARPRFALVLFGLSMT